MGCSRPAPTPLLLLVAASLLAAPAAGQGRTCAAWPGEPDPLPTVSDSDPFLARWSELRARELRELADATPDGRPGTVAALRAHAACLSPRNLSGARALPVRIRRMGLAAPIPRLDDGVEAPVQLADEGAGARRQALDAWAGAPDAPPEGQARPAPPAEDAVRGRGSVVGLEPGWELPTTATADPQDLDGARARSIASREPGAADASANTEAGAAAPPVTPEAPAAPPAAIVEASAAPAPAIVEAPVTPRRATVGAEVAPPRPVVGEATESPAPAAGEGTPATTRAVEAEPARPERPAVAEQLRPERAVEVAEPSRAEPTRRVLSAPEPPAAAEPEASAFLATAAPPVLESPPARSLPRIRTLPPPASDAPGPGSAAPRRLRPAPAPESRPAPPPLADVAAPPPARARAVASVSAGREPSAPPPSPALLDAPRRHVRDARFEAALAAIDGVRPKLTGDEAAPLRAELEVLAATASLALGRPEDARQRFAAGLTADPSLELDPAIYSPKLRDMLSRVRADQGVTP